MGSAHLDASRVQVRLVDLEIFRGKHCWVRFLKYFQECRVFFLSIFFLARSALLLVSANQTPLDISKKTLFLSDEDRFAFIECYSPIYGFGTSLWRTTRRRTELARATSLPPVKWAMA